MMGERLTSTTTSLLPMNSGIVLAWTGVIRSKFMLEMASSSHGDSDGTTASQARVVEPSDGGIIALPWSVLHRRDQVLLLL